MLRQERYECGEHLGYIMEWTRSRQKVRRSRATVRRITGEFRNLEDRDLHNRLVAALPPLDLVLKGVTQGERGIHGVRRDVLLRTPSPPPLLGDDEMGNDEGWETFMEKKLVDLRTNKDQKDHEEDNAEKEEGERDEDRQQRLETSEDNLEDKVLKEEEQEGVVVLRVPKPAVEGDLFFVK